MRSVDNEAGMMLSAPSYDRLLFMAVAALARGVPLLGYITLYNALSAHRPSDVHRIQKDKWAPPDLVKAASWKAFTDQTIVQIPLLWFSYDLFTWIGAPALDSELPRLRTVVEHILFFIVTCDTITYWTHRMLHQPYFYSTFHKQHHEFHTNHPLASTYFSFVDDLLTGRCCNLHNVSFLVLKKYFVAGTVPTLFGPIFLRSHVMVVLLWVAIRICETSEAHLSYLFKNSFFSVFGRPADFHDFHHSHNTGNFGSFFTFWDWLCGTERAYYQWKRSKEGPWPQYLKILYCVQNVMQGLLLCFIFRKYFG